MKLKAHKLVVVHDGNSEGANGFGVGRTAYLDGVELIMPEDAPVTVVARSKDIIQATFTVFADVEFRGEAEKRDNIVVRLWHQFYPFTRD